MYIINKAPLIFLFSSENLLNKLKSHWPVWHIIKRQCQEGHYYPPVQPHHLIYQTNFKSYNDIQYTCTRRNLSIMNEKKQQQAMLIRYPHHTVMVNKKKKHYLEYKGDKKSVTLPKVFFFTWNFVQSIRKLQNKLWYK